MLILKTKNSLNLNKNKNREEYNHSLGPLYKPITLQIPNISKKENNKNTNKKDII